MKKILFLKRKIFVISLSLFLIYFVLFCNNNVNYCNLNGKIVARAHQTNTIVYAKANDNCVLYKSQTISNAISNVYFSVPSTYFVSIISRINDDIYRVQYDNFVGYVSANSVDIVSFVPSAPKLAKITFDISQKAGTQIWSLPSDASGNILTTISADTKNIEYIASTTGDIPIGGNTNIWYYARFTPANNTTSVYEGYVYSEATTNLSHIPTNLEYEPTEIEIAEKQIEVGGTAQIIMIILICLPFFVLLVLACIKIVGAIKERSQKRKAFLHSQAKDEISATPKQFVRKKSDDNVVEVVFPEYNYIDDDDLL